METRKFLFRETLWLAIGECICLGVMLLIYALLGFWDRSVLLGGVVGTLLGILNFFFMGISADAAADKATAQNVKGGKNTIRLSYQLRLIIMFVILVACAKSGLCNALAMVLPIVFVRPVLTVVEFFRKPGDKQA